MAAEGKDGATPSEAAIPAVTEAAKPVDAPAGAVVSTPAKTTATVGVPADSGQLSAPSSWSDPLLALGISVGFVLTVVLAAWFFRKTSHA